MSRQEGYSAYAEMFEEAEPTPYNGGHVYRPPTRQETTVNDFIQVRYNGNRPRRGYNVNNALKPKEHRFNLDGYEPKPLEENYNDVRIGYVVTHDLRKNYSHFIYGNDGIIYKIPTWLSECPKYQHSERNKWGKRFTPEFGETLSFVCHGEDKTVITNYRKRERQNEIEVVGGVDCVS